MTTRLTGHNTDCSTQSQLVCLLESWSDLKNAFKDAAMALV